MAIAPRLGFGAGDPTVRVDAGRLWWATVTATGPATASLEPRDLATARAWGPGADELLTRLPALLGRNDDPSGFVARDQVVADLLRRHGVPTIGATGDVVSALVQAVFGQRVTTEEGQRSWRALVHRHGTPAPGPLTGLRAPPSSDALAAMPYFAFHPLGVDRRRAETIIGAARRPQRLASLTAASRDEAERTLLALPGIGPWSAAHVRLVALGDPDAVPVGDLHLPSIVTWALAGERRGTDARMLELLEPYRGHRARAVRLIGRTRGPGRRAPRRRIEPMASR